MAKGPRVPNEAETMGVGVEIGKVGWGMASFAFSERYEGRWLHR